MYQAHSPSGSSMAGPYHGCPEFSPDDRQREMIAQAAYFRAKRRGFAPGHELEDWLVAEGEVDSALTIGLPQ